MKLIGIGGTDGSGKDTVGYLLEERYGWQFVSVSDFLRIELRSRGKRLTRKSMRRLSAEWRRELGMGALVDKAVDIYEPRKYSGLVLASLRNPGEADEIHKLGGKVVWVDADPKIRFGRITRRKKGTEDEVTFEEFLVEEQAQMDFYGDDSHTLNLAGVKKRSDFLLENNGSDIEKFKDEAEKALSSILKSN
jgi:dephospho-CoA kinase